MQLGEALRRGQLEILAQQGEIDVLSIGGDHGVGLERRRHAAKPTPRKSFYPESFTALVPLSERSLRAGHEVGTFVAPFVFRFAS